jgi:hypothetical protein
MPSQQCRRRDDERSPTRAWQESAGGAEKQAVNRGDRRTSHLPAKNREFVPQHDDLKFLQLLRPNAQHHEFQKPAKLHVAQRHEHEASYAGGYGPFYASALPNLFLAAQAPDRIRIYAPCTVTFDGAIGRTPARLVLVDAMELAWQRAKYRGRQRPLLAADPGLVGLNTLQHWLWQRLQASPTSQVAA